MVLDDPPFPSALTWVSKRLTQEIVALDTAKRHPVRVDFKIKPPGVPLEAIVERRELTSVEDYAVAATKIVRRRTGSLQRPDEFIRMALDFHVATFAVPSVWENRSTQRVSTLFASQFVPGVGRVFVALFGSPHSILARKEKETYTGRTPSDADGLYEILNHTREPEDVQLSRWTLDHPRQSTYSPEERADLAAQVIFGLVDPLPPRRMDVLARADVVVRNHTLNSGYQYPYDLIVIGAALWGGTPARSIDPSAIPGLSGAQVHYWPLFDIQLFEFLDERRTGGAPQVPAEVLSDDEETWQAYASWFVNLGSHLGYPKTQMSARRRPNRLNPMRYLKRSWQYSYDEKPTGDEGFILHMGQHSSVLVTSSGDVFPVFELPESNCLYRPRHRSEWLNPRQRPADVPIELMHEVRRTMWEVAAEWRGRLH